MKLLDKLFQHCTPDCIHISEDMAYKAKAMISPVMCREFLMPAWRRWGDQAHAAGVPIYAVDSDGYVGELIPLWIESGFQMNDPLEVAAGNDLPAYRRQFGKRMAYSGGIDKRAMAKGGDVIKAEMRRSRDERRKRAPCVHSRLNYCICRAHRVLQQELHVLDRPEDVIVSGLQFDYHRPTVSEFMVRAVAGDHAELVLRGTFVRQARHGGGP